LAEDRRAISVQLARVTRGQSQLLRVFEVGCTASSSAMICPIPKLTVQSARPGFPAVVMQVEVWAASPEPAVGVSTPAGTCPGRLRRHCVIGYADPGQNPTAVRFGSSRVRGRGLSKTRARPPGCAAEGSMVVTRPGPPRCQSCWRHFAGGESAGHVPGGRAGVAARVYRPATGVAQRRSVAVSPVLFQTYQLRFQ
jgi:hypothetical protein